jgi:hypothetical protein
MLLRTKLHYLNLQTIIKSIFTILIQSSYVAIKETIINAYLIMISILFIKKLESSTKIINTVK